jgi:hypothetical protein
MTDSDRFIVTDCATVKDFLDTYYRRDRYRGRGEDYAASLLASAQRRFEEHGYTLISRHDSVTGCATWYYGTAADAARALFAEAEEYADRAEHFRQQMGRHGVDNRNAEEHFRLALDRQQALVRQAMELVGKAEV